MRETRFQVVHEMIGGAGAPLPDKQAGDKFRVDIERNPSPTEFAGEPWKCSSWAAIGGQFL